MLDNGFIAWFLLVLIFIGMFFAFKLGIYLWRMV